jgi:hypothetical protein
LQPLVKMAIKLVATGKVAPVYFAVQLLIEPFSTIDCRPGIG